MHTLKRSTAIIICLTLFFVLALAFSSCGENEPPKNSNSSNVQTGSTDTGSGSTNTGTSDKNEAEKLTVVFDSNGGTAVDSQSVEMNKKVQEPTKPTREGCTFDGWYLGEGKWSFVGYTVTEDMTLVAKWTPIIYSIEYVGGVTHTNKKTYTIEDGFELSDGNKSYYEFLGWYEDESYTKPITKIEKGTTGNKTLYAKIETTALTYELKDNEYIVTECDKGATSVIIPSTHNGKPVTSIGYEAFCYCTSLTSIEIPNSVTSIGDYAFYYCKSLTSVVIPDSVTTIGYAAFRDCTSLKYNVYDNGYYLGNGENPYLVLVKAKDKYITSCAINESTKLICSSAFRNCTSLKSIEIPNSVTSIGYEAFRACDSLTIYCEAESQPSDWNSSWNYSNCPVVWGHTHAYENGSCVCGKAEN